MGLFERIFAKELVKVVTSDYMGTLTGYQPVFRTFGGGVYEAELCRSCIHAFASHVSKLKPQIQGARAKDLQKIMEFQPNPYMDTSKFLYKLASILEAENTAFIVPLYDKYFEKIVGFYPVQPRAAEVHEKDKKQYIVFQFANGKRAAVEFENVGIMTKFYYSKDFFGEDNNAIRETLNLASMQKQGINEGIKQGATIRFLGRLAMAMKETDIEKERKRWNETNLSIDNQGGIALFDTKYTDVKPIASTPYTIDKGQIEAVQDSVFSYFGTSKEILQNSYDSNRWNAYYEGKIEPFALQLSLVLSNMLYTAEQKTRGNQIMFTANRLQYASVAEKLQVARDLSDRGMLSRNEGREIFNLDPVEGGDEYIIRGEYYNTKDKVDDSTGEDE